jgi:hypothetical protein
MNHHNTTLALALLGVGATVALAPTGALAQSACDASTPANAHVAAVHRHDHPHPSITFTNPLGRSRGLGAGAGVL